ncbi:transglutaminase family protein [Alphaproteobacteria bacterium GH1-50]|uniref:Transglutaminase family protein n=1 Tax=Kangsaoukella pontilimi TaxID=2691042 RepID=A0A7C9MVB1_9RHOB|nr:transglutaminase family protein [Kangsaoukella pontilimi]MXQ06714.1 transglutaminase family protein [Kangsaoukella pontilimi]
MSRSDAGGERPKGASGGRVVEIDVHMVYDVDLPTDMILQIEAAEGEGQTILSQSLSLSGAEAEAHGTGEAGIGRRSRFIVSDRLTCRYKAQVEITRPSPRLRRLAGTPLTDLPGDTIRYLMPSRYSVPSDFAATDDTLFGQKSGGAFIAAASDWISENITYSPGASTPDTTAADTFMRREGICRDFAHVLISMARARGIPARFVACYDPGVEPPDFHAVAQVWLDGGWHLVDPTGMASPESIAIIGVGLDAAEVSFLTVFGRTELVKQRVTVS